MRPETIDAIRSLTGTVKDSRESIARADAALGISKQVALTGESTWGADQFSSNHPDKLAERTQKGALAEGLPYQTLNFDLTRPVA